ncbi:RNA recognition motif domain-containing protein [Blastopirellula retiformator]|uniref:RNA recognition motif (RRM, RBD, or RNP domain) n=1 Tax=Blastopirellula retiformator TaxID=2527970 RepID=A0A5C5V8M3_9BACT|nr:RNA-binding protein [Blastopirellula retiformator]TWT34360.1 RNA recognition motif (RRM, RBD, or RNP domain) [Blastopirellula retiformator]
MGKKLYCGNLTYNTCNADLERLFGEYGVVREAQVIVDRDTGRSKGFGFIEMESDEDAHAAIAGLNEFVQDGRPLIVNEAKPRENRSGGSRSFSGGGRRY